MIRLAGACLLMAGCGALGLGATVLQLWEEIAAGAEWDTLVRQRAPHLIANTFPFFSVDKNKKEKKKKKTKQKKTSKKVLCLF